jgi:hypothetical protein
MAIIHQHGGDLQLAAESIRRFLRAGAGRVGATVLPAWLPSDGMFGNETDSDCVGWRCGR